MKLRVAQLKGGTGGDSLRRWYSSTSDTERGIYVLLSAILILAYGLGLIPLIGLLLLAAGERDELARQSRQAELEQQAKQAGARLPDSAPNAKEKTLSTVATVSPSQNNPKPMWHVFAALAAAVVASILTQSIQQHGTFAALSNATLLSNLIAGAVGMMLILPGINVAIGSIWQSIRNSRARRNIYFWWGVVVAILQVLILASRLSANG